MKLAQIATVLIEGVQSYPSDWEGFKNDAQSRGFQVTQQNGNYVVTHQGQMVGFWDGNAGGGVLTDNPATYQQYIKNNSVGKQVRNDRNQEARELPAKMAAAAREVAGSAVKSIGSFAGIG